MTLRRPCRSNSSMSDIEEMPPLTVRTVADRVIFLENGKIVEENDSETFFSHPESDRAKDFLYKVMH